MLCDTTGGCSNAISTCTHDVQTTTNNTHWFCIKYKADQPLESVVIEAGKQVSQVECLMEVRCHCEHATLLITNHAKLPEPPASLLHRSTQTTTARQIPFQEHVTVAQRRQQICQLQHATVLSTSGLPGRQPRLALAHIQAPQVVGREVQQPRQHRQQAAVHRQAARLEAAAQHERCIRQSRSYSCCAATSTDNSPDSLLSSEALTMHTGRSLCLRRGVWSVVTTGITIPDDDVLHVRHVHLCALFPPPHLRKLLLQNSRGAIPQPLRLLPVQQQTTQTCQTDSSTKCKQYTLPAALPAALAHGMAQFSMLSGCGYRTVHLWQEPNCVYVRELWGQMLHAVVINHERQALPCFKVPSFVQSNYGHLSSRSFCSAASRDCSALSSSCRAPCTATHASVCKHVPDLRELGFAPPLPHVRTMQSFCEWTACHDTPKSPCDHLNTATSGMSANMSAWEQFLCLQS